ncbi:MAG: hypothetical protein GX609_10210 [Actinomycetales bacterium]|nr:hypothetical protein [Actinomycetales bacterium]
MLLSTPEPLPLFQLVRVHWLPAAVSLVVHQAPEREQRPARERQNPWSEGL